MSALTGCEELTDLVKKLKNKKQKQDGDLFIEKKKEIIEYIKTKIPSESEPYSDSRFNHYAAQLIQWAYYNDLFRELHENKRQPVEFPTTLAVCRFTRRNEAHVGAIYGQTFRDYMKRTRIDEETAERISLDFFDELIKQQE